MDTGGCSLLVNLCLLREASSLHRPGSVQHLCSVLCISETSGSTDTEKGVGSWGIYVRQGRRTQASPGERGQHPKLQPQGLCRSTEHPLWGGARYPPIPDQSREAPTETGYLGYSSHQELEISHNAWPHLRRLLSRLSRKPGGPVISVVDLATRHA